MRSGTKSKNCQSSHHTVYRTISLEFVFADLLRFFLEHSYVLVLPGHTHMGARSRLHVTRKPVMVGSSSEVKAMAPLVLQRR
jgi:hypothetical protein